MRAEFSKRTFVEVFREEEKIYQFVWNVNTKRYSLEIDLKDNCIFLTHLYTTYIFDFNQLEALCVKIRESFVI